MLIEQTIINATCADTIINATDSAAEVEVTEAFSAAAAFAAVAPLSSEIT